MVKKTSVTSYVSCLRGTQLLVYQQNKEGTLEEAGFLLWKRLKRDNMEVVGELYLLHGNVKELKLNKKKEMDYYMSTLLYSVSCM